MKPDVIADLGIGANADVIDTHQFDKVVVVVEYTVDVLARIVAERVGHRGDAAQSTPRCAGQQLLVRARATGGSNGKCRVVAEDHRDL